VRLSGRASGGIHGPSGSTPPFDRVHRGKKGGSALPEIMVDSRRCLACRSCEVACAINRDSVSKTVAGAFKEEVRPTPRVVVQGNERIALPIQCRHCEEALCVDSCPSGALYRSADDNLVLLDDNRCIGCWMCVAVCPFGAIKPSGAGKVAIKCDACRGMEHPFCVEACPTGALVLMEPAALQEVARRRAGEIIATLFQHPQHAADAAGARGESTPATYVKLTYSSGRGGL